MEGSSASRDDQTSGELDHAADDGSSVSRVNYQKQKKMYFLVFGDILIHNPLAEKLQKTDLLAQIVHRLGIHLIAS